MDIKALAQQCEPYIIDRRRHYHSCPDISEHEEHTRAEIRKDLEALGITEIVELKDCYGMTAMIRGGKPGKTIGLRTDIDGLKIVEETGLPFAATNGNMHACGHDAHIAMLLGAAKILSEHKEELCGNVKLLFQPAEEIAQGARYMLRENAMDGVDALYGAHIWGDFDAPLIDVTPGNRMAGADLLTLNVQGVAAHGSAPHLGIDAITAAAAIINNIQQYVSRMNDPLNPLVVTIGEIHGGTRFNVIPNFVTMEATIRTFSSDGASERIIRQIAEGTAAALGVQVTLDYRYVAIPVINKDPKLNRIAHDAVVKLYGEESIGHLPTMMGSEDFSILGQNVPHFYAFIGSRNPDKGIVYTNHHEKFTVDESVLQRGSALMAQFAVDFLAEG